LAAFDGRPVDFEVEGVESGLFSFGHRFYAPEKFEASRLNDLLSQLRKHKVEPDPDVRRKQIVEPAAATVQGVVDLPEGLVEENVFLTEWPTIVEGEFEPSYLELPESVLVTAMAKHEKMFPVRGSTGLLTNRFVFVRNSGENEQVRRGCQWVLNARFNDAKFFFDEDRRFSLDQFLERTSGILFMDRLGTVRQRSDRLVSLSESVGAATGADESEIHLLKTAAKYAKADLSTGLVSELASLQGIVGAEYASREGFDEAVCWAIRTQYDLAKNSEPGGPSQRTAVRLVVADQIDRLAGCLGIGMAPSGSSDPYALRRAASLLIEAAWNWPRRMVSLSEVFDSALDGYEAQGLSLDRSAAVGSLRDLFSTRYSGMLPEVRYDVLQAAIIAPDGPYPLDPQAVAFRVRLLETLIEDKALVQTATRPINLVIAAKKKGFEFGSEDPLSRVEHSALESASGLGLLQLAGEQAGSLRAAQANLDDDSVLSGLRQLVGPINRFFEDTMVMVDQPDVRYARLTLLHGVSQLFLTAGDFSKIVVEG
jgi:glycyl-tRNA synthetase beta chain